MHTSKLLNVQEKKLREAGTMQGWQDHSKGQSAVRRRDQRRFRLNAAEHHGELDPFVEGIPQSQSSSSFEISFSAGQFFGTELVQSH